MKKILLSLALLFPLVAQAEIDCREVLKVNVDNYLGKLGKIGKISNMGKINWGLEVKPVDNFRGIYQNGALVTDPTKVQIFGIIVQNPYESGVSATTAVTYNTTNCEVYVVELTAYNVIKPKLGVK